MRQVCFGKVEKFSEYELTGLLAEYKQQDYIILNSVNAQQVVKLLFKNWKSYFVAVKDYEKNPRKYKEKPGIPKYKDKKGLGICIFTGDRTPIKDGFIHFPKKANLEPIRTKQTNINQVRIVPQASCFVVEVVYETKIRQNGDLKKENFLAIDLGLNNLATSINNAGFRPFIINGKVLKSVNQMFNKTKAKLMSHVGNRGTSNRIKQLTHYRNNFIEDKLHKISRHIVDYCLIADIGTLVIGHNKGWKDSINIGKKNNQKFVNIPHSKLIDKIRYKAELEGIEVKITEESYTSKVDHLAFEEMCKHEVYLGKRKKRGLFQSSIKKIINADINGAIGIARKVFGNSVLEPIINSGLAFNPYKINIL